MATGMAPEAAHAAQEGLVAAQRGLAVTTLVGGDDERRRAVDAVAAPERHDVRVLGPTDQVPSILEDSDLVVGKSGGLTSAEAMAVGCPMAILLPRPDQEEQNTDVLLEHGAAVRVFRAPLLAPKIDGLFGDGVRWTSLRRGAYRLGRPDAARRIADAVLGLAGAAPSSARSREHRRPG